MSTEPSSLRERVTSGAVWSLSRNVIMAAVGIATTAILAHFASPADFGFVTFITSITTFVNLVTSGGFGPALIRRTFDTKEFESTAFWINVALSVTAGLLLFALAGPIELWANRPHSTLLFGFLLLQLPFVAATVVPETKLLKQFRFGAIAARDLISTLGSSILAVILAVLGLGIWALVANTVLAVAITTVLTFGFTRWHPAVVFSREAAGDLFRFGSMVMLGNLLSTGRDSITNLIIGTFAGQSALGIWSIATTIGSKAMKLVASVLNQIALPAFAAVRNDPARLRRIYGEAVTRSSVVCIPIGFGLAAVSGVLIPLLYGGQWSDGVVIAAWWGIVTSMTVVQWLDTDLWWAIGKPSIVLVQNSVLSAVHILVVLVFVRFGLVPTAIGIAALGLVTALISVWSLWRFGDIPPRTYVGAPPAFLVSAVMLGAVLAITPLCSHLSTIVELAVLVLVGGVVYLGLSWLFQRKALSAIVADASTALRQPSKTT